MPVEEQRSGGMRSGAHEGLMCPLEKGVRGIETSGSGYLRQQIRGGRKGRAERQGLGQSPNEKQGRWLGQLVVLSNSPRACRYLARQTTGIKIKSTSE